MERQILNFRLCLSYLKSSGFASKSTTPIITCKRPQYNHYKGQTYGKFEGVTLASQGWMHPKSKGDYFIIHSEHGEMKKSAVNSPKTFSYLKLNNEIITVLNELKFETPTEIQHKAVPFILDGNNTLVTAETGCGKTLAYLLPILNQILLWKSRTQERTLNSPLAVVITPSRELATQIARVAETILSKFNVHTSLLVGGKTKQKMLNPCFEECDLLVTTLGAFSKLVTTGIYKINEVRHVVLDEADTLLDDSFSEKLIQVLRKFPFQYKVDIEAPAGSGCQLTMASATMPQELPDVLSNFIDPESIKKVSTANLHKLLPHVPQKFMRLGKGHKPTELLKIVQADVNMKRPVMIFSNKVATCDWVSMFLNENNIKCVNINGTMPVPIKQGKFDQFNQGEVPVISCTDVVSRGMDTTVTRHVLNYDFPVYIADYIHRCGRTGRLGSPEDCRVTNFVAWTREINLVQKIEMSVRKMNDLPSVNANISRLIQDRISNLQERDMKKLAQSM